MDADGHRDKKQLVWASVFLTVYAAWCLTMIFNGEPGPEIRLAAIAITVGLLVSVITVPLLLLFSGAGRGLLVAGRSMVCLQLLAQLTALAIVIGIMVSS